MNKRLKELISETGIPDTDLKISADNITRRVTASITAALSERKRYIRRKIFKASLIAACAAVVCTAAAFAASPVGREAIGNIISYFQNDRVNQITDTEELAKYSAQIGESVTKDGITLTLDNAAADDNYLHVFYTLKSDEPFYDGSEPIGHNAYAKAYEKMWVEVRINGQHDVSAAGNHSSTQGYFADRYTFKTVCKYNISASELPDTIKVEVFADKHDSENPIDLTELQNRGLTDEEKSRIWYVSADIDRKAAKEATVTAQTNINIPDTDASIEKIVLSPFGSQLVTTGSGNIAEKVALFDENGVSLDILDTDVTGEENSYEFLKADTNTKEIKIVPILSADAETGEISHKIGDYPIRYELPDGLDSIVVTDVRTDGGVVSIDYYKDGFVPCGIKFGLRDENNCNVAPDGITPMPDHGDRVHYDTNSYTARLIFGGYDETGYYIVPDENVSDEVIKQTINSLTVTYPKDVKLDYDNAQIVKLH